MISWLVDMIESIFGLIGTLITLLVSTVESMVVLIGQLPNYLNFVSSMSLVVPTFATVFVLAGVSLTLVLFIRSLL